MARFPKTETLLALIKTEFTSQLDVIIKIAKI